jgi:hypothetical protein
VPRAGCVARASGGVAEEDRREDDGERRAEQLLGCVECEDPEGPRGLFATGLEEENEQGGNQQAELCGDEGESEDVCVGGRRLSV